MSRQFQIIPKRVKHVNGTVLTPEMVVTVTTQQHTARRFIMERKRCRRPTCVFTALTTRRLVARQTISISESWTERPMWGKVS